jgi:DNA-directed RNA polymerase subunit RPC12/RpoP
MPKEILKKLLYSLAITICVSILGGLFCLNFGFNFWITSSFFFILQFIGFYFYGEHVKRRNAIIEAEFEMIAASELAKITADVVCPCDKKVQTTIPIQMNIDNSYTCSQCSKRIGVILDVKTALKTEPLQQDPLVNPIVAKNVEEALKDPTHNDRI